MKSRLRELREERGFTVEELAKKADVPVEIIKNADNKHISDLDIISALNIAKALGVFLEDIFELEEGD